MCWIGNLLGSTDYSVTLIFHIVRPSIWSPWSEWYSPFDWVNLISATFQIQVNVELPEALVEQGGQKGLRPPNFLPFRPTSSRIHHKFLPGHKRETLPRISHPAKSISDNHYVSITLEILRKWSEDRDWQCLVKEDGKACKINRHVHIRIIENYKRGLPTQFKRNWLQIAFGCGLHYKSAHFGRSCKGNLKQTNINFSNTNMYLRWRWTVDHESYGWLWRITGIPYGSWC